MSGTFKGNVTTNFSFQENIAVGTISPSGFTLSQSIAQTTNYNTPGTGSGQINLVYGNQITFVASTPQTFNMQTWTDPLGNALDFLRVRELVFQVVSMTPGWNIELYSPSSNGVTFLPPVSNYLPIFAGGMICFRDPVSTGAGIGALITSSACQFTINPGANPVVVNILAGGGTAV
jgi:hypothetical protein